VARDGAGQRQEPHVGWERPPPQHGDGGTWATRVGADAFHDVGGLTLTEILRGGQPPEPGQWDNVKELVQSVLDDNEALRTDRLAALQSAEQAKAMAGDHTKGTKAARRKSGVAFAP